MQAGVGHIISVGIDLASSTAALNLAQKHAHISCAVGCHPHHAETCRPSDLDHLAQLASEALVAAWGEIGLDYFRRYASTEAQLRVFEDQLGLAKDLKLPVIIHDREAHEATFSMLKRMGKGERKGVIHCFSGDVDVAHAFLGLGYLVSIPGTVTYKNAKQIKEVAVAIPLSGILIETDSPFLSPEPKRGKRNEPAHVYYTAMEIARLRGISFEDVARETTKNAQALFRLPPDPTE